MIKIFSLIERVVNRKRKEEKMALIIIDNSKKLNGRVKVFDSATAIQEEYCHAIEMELVNGNVFFDNSNVKEYLNEFDITYTGRYTLLHKWDGMKEATERFVTWLNYPLQLACLALYYSYDILLTSSQFCCDEHLLPVLKKRDIYVCLDEDYDVDLWKFTKLVDNGVEIRIEGKSSNNMSYEEFCNLLFELEKEYQYLSREVDAKYFGNCKIAFSAFKPEVMSLYEYIKKYDDEHIDKPEWHMKHVPDLNQVMVRVNGSIKSFNLFRRYPIHYLFHMKDEWKYISNNSVKNPTLLELLMDAVLAPKPFDYNLQKEVDISSADKIFVLVLNCNEICNARRYWDFINFIAKYDMKSKCLEICNANETIYEFHKCLSESTDL